MFLGENLKTIRLLYGISRKELGQYLNVTNQSIWLFERNSLEPRLENNIELFKIFPVKTAYFSRELPFQFGFNLNQLNFRLSMSHSKKKLTSEITWLDFYFGIFHYLEQFFNYTSLKFHTFKEEMKKLYRESTEPPENSITQIALQSREYLNLTDNRQLVSKLEKNGVYVIEKELENVDHSYSIWSNTHQAVIVLNKNQTAVSRTYDMAHELGHLLLHSERGLFTSTVEDNQQLEEEAHQFAMNFLLPNQSFIEDFKQSKKRTNPDLYIDLKSKYYVSIKHLEERAYQLKLVTANQHRYFYKVYIDKRYRYKEPLDDELSSYRPQKLNYLFKQTIIQRFTSLSKIEDRFNVKRQFLIDVFGFDHSYFDQLIDITSNVAFSDYYHHN